MDHLKNFGHTFVRGFLNLSNEPDEGGSREYTSTSRGTRSQKAGTESKDAPSATHSGPTPEHPLRGSLSKYSRQGKPEARRGISPRPQTYRRTSQTRKLEEYKRRLGTELERLVGATSGMREDNMRKNAELESLVNRDNAGKYEDELFDLRLEELRNAQTLIQTNSSTSEREIRGNVRRLNDEIIRVARDITKIMTEKDPQGGLEEIGVTLGDGFIGFFPESQAEHSMERSLVEAILRIFLAGTSMSVIDSWNLKAARTGNTLNYLYDRIKSEEEPMVAGKWRQIAFTQVSRGQNTEDLEGYAGYKAQKVTKILSCAGWEGDTEKIQQEVRQLMLKAERVRTDVKGGIISPDCQPWVAEYGEKHESLAMRDVCLDFGIDKTKDAEGCPILGSTGLGLKVDGHIGMRTRVVHIESFRNLRRRSSRR